ncbi:MAG: transglycosylase domain-containing protein, partial [Bacteroidota bacterium]
MEQQENNHQFKKTEPVPDRQTPTPQGPEEPKDPQDRMGAFGESLKTTGDKLKVLAQRGWQRSVAWYQRQTGLWWKVPVGLIVAGGASVILLVLLIRFGAFGALPPVEELSDIHNHNAAEVYADDGVLLGKYFVENRTNVSHEEISPAITNALVATEDARFFEHGGVDMRAWVRVLFRTIIMRDRSGGGGSTLSQQLAKNLYPRRDYAILDIPITKIKEMFIARRLEKIYTKEELLAMYLNTVPFGRNIFGVEVAARQFFQTNAGDIRQEQAAVLVGMLKANTAYDPVRHPERSKGRRNVVLSQMQKYSYLDATVADSLKALPLEVNYVRESNTEGPGTYFREHIRLELEDKLAELSKENGTEYNLYTDGLKIYTTIDSRMQRYAEQAVKETMAGLQKDFDKHWKGRKVWGSDKVLQQLIEKTDRYKTMKAAGADEKQIEAAFNTKMPMTVFSWDGKEEKEMTPLDSIKYYYAMLNAGFMA